MDGDALLAGERGAGGFAAAAYGFVTQVPPYRTDGASIAIWFMTNPKAGSMWNWFKKEPRPDRGPEEPKIRGNPSPDDPIAACILVHAYMLEADQREEVGDNEYFAVFAINLLKKIKSQQPPDLNSDSVDFIDGMFLTCLSSVISYHLRLNFELMSKFAMAFHYGLRGSVNWRADLMSEVIHNYNLMLRKA